MVLTCILRSRRASTSFAEVSRLFPNVLALRSFRADATDPEIRGEDDSDDPCCTSVLTDTHKACSGRSRRHASGAVSSETHQAAGQRGPVRAAQPRKGERRKVLPVLAGDKFTSNVATLLVRWQHAASSPSRLPRNWQEVCDSDRFRRLFPLRPTPLTEGAVQGLRALAASEAYDPSDGEADGRLPAWGDALPQQYDAHQAALLELVDRLQAVQQHLEDSMSNDGDGTILALTFTHDDDDDGSRDIDNEEGEKPSVSPYHIHGQPGCDDSPCSNEVGDAAGSNETRSRDGSGVVTMRTPLGRCRRRPEGCQRGPRIAQPWDDRQPFQTNVGTVYHFWRLCPYG
ncbi:hypothetical protein Vretimale_17688 [Volvox reticuliferus]|uniref:Uncharacterized protein n=1 Tax=Volvox reticuliferus TaxID=1737510 RepID=A0A8J4GWR3_9CHLO|nr:hypothetical protein Vretifemale_3588 [Volvox reticuliferus]GIM14813.1 hypothetical protein Vretimale_17688 [Volvox reticuliferus]